MAVTGLFVVSSVLAAPPPDPAHPGRIEQITTQIASPQPPTPTWVIVAAALLAFAVSGSFVLVSWLVTAAHEGAHGLVAGAWNAFGGIEIHPKRSGNPPATKVSYEKKWFGFIVGAFAGYLGPSAFGLLGAYLLSRQYVEGTLWTAIVLLGALLWVMANAFGVFVVLVLGSALVAVAWTDAPGFHAVAAYLIVWTLLWHGIQDVFGRLGPAARAQDRKARKAKKGMSDHAHLRARTFVPSGMWVLAHLVIGVFAFFVGTRLMLF